MSELGGLDIAGPDESAGGAPEELSEEAKARFAANAAAAKQVRKQEKKSRKRDDQVAKTIIQFLGDDKYSHLFVLISRLVARDCPSIFVLSIISLVHDGCKEEVQTYLKDTIDKTSSEEVEESIQLTEDGHFDDEANRTLVEWITRMQMVLALEPEKILLKLMVDEGNIDGTVLQLATFVMKDYLANQHKKTPFEKIQPLTANILQAVFEPFLPAAKKAFLEQAPQKEEDDA